MASWAQANLPQIITPSARPKLFFSPPNRSRSSLLATPFGLVHLVMIRAWIKASGRLRSGQPAELMLPTNSLNQATLGGESLGKNQALGCELSPAPGRQLGDSKLRELTHRDNWLRDIEAREHNLISPVTAKMKGRFWWNLASSNRPRTRPADWCCTFLPVRDRPSDQSPRLNRRVLVAKIDRRVT